MDHPSPSASSLSRTLTVFVIELSICVGLLFAWYTIRPGDTLGDPLSSTTVKSSETPISEEVDLLDTHLDELVLSVAPKENIIIADVVPQSSPGEKYIFELSVRDLEKAEIMKATLLRILESNAYGPLISPITIEITDQRSEPRGRMTLGRVSLIVTIPSESEMIKVFTHELAHVIDLEYLLPGSFSRDPSEIFYDISWIALKTKKKWQKLEDFPSGYAMTNKYEDFAESFSLYVFHNSFFESRTSPVLREKYAFFQKYVFIDDQWQGTDFAVDPAPSYLWDTTKIPIATNKYLFYIK